MLIIDANVFAAFYQEEELGIAPAVLRSPVNIFSRLGEDVQAYLDDGKMIETEWRRKADREWFDGWLADALRDDRVREVTVSNHPQLIKRLSKLGFPRGSRDKWYVRTGKEVADRLGQSCIVSEDLDFFDPKAKASGSKRRVKILKRRSGDVLKALEDENIYVHSTWTCC